MTRTLQTIAVLFGVMYCAGRAAMAIQEEGVKDPSRFVAALSAQQRLDRTLARQVADVVTALVQETPRWSRGQVNGPYDSHAVNVYLIDIGTATADSGEWTGLHGTLQALPRHGIILADARYLAQIKAATDVYLSDKTAKAGELLGSAMVEGPDAFVRSRLGGGADWRRDSNSLFAGAVAFLVAHEMGHLDAGLHPQPRRYERSARGASSRDADIQRACASLVGTREQVRLQEERDADTYAVRLIGAIGRPGRLRYEFGTVFLGIGEMQKAMAAMAALSPRVEALAASARISPAMIAAMRHSLGQGAQMFVTVFPSSHPASVERLLDTAAQLSRNRNSEFHGDRDADNNRRMWGMITGRMCGTR